VAGAGLNLRPRVRPLSGSWRYRTVGDAITGAVIGHPQGPTLQHVRCLPPPEIRSHGPNIAAAETSRPRTVDDFHCEALRCPRGRSAGTHRCPGARRLARHRSTLNRAPSASSPRAIYSPIATAPPSTPRHLPGFRAEPRTRRIHGGISRRRAAITPTALPPTARSTTGRPACHQLPGCPRMTNTSCGSLGSPQR
jgi:hypothetical protein